MARIILLKKEEVLFLENQGINDGIILKWFLG
jgi:hypothetical protein